jgi:hypothetical protein
MENKVKFGQFYTKRSQYIIGNLLEDLDKELKVVEPFCGEGDLLIFDNEYEIYDIDPKIEGCELRDTLTNPPSYEGKLVVTNPPFLARNKNKDKTLYDLYEVGDLYKVAIKSIQGCSGGILIVPLNFFCDEDNKIRDMFFSRSAANFSYMFCFAGSFANVSAKKSSVSILLLTSLKSLSYLSA